METKFSIEEEVELISRYYDFLSYDKIRRKAIESIYNRHLELIKDILMKDIDKPLSINLKIEGGLIISVIG